MTLLTINLLGLVIFWTNRGCYSIEDQILASVGVLGNVLALLYVGIPKKKKNAI